jgi:hypothetical protein
MKLAYVAGPYRGKSKNKIINKLQVIRDILAAREVAKELWRMGYAVLCPHSNTALFDGVAPDQTFLDGDLLILDRCDLIVLQGKWWDSKGTLGEIKRAKQNEMPIFEWRKGLIPFEVHEL